MKEMSITRIYRKQAYPARNALNARNRIIVRYCRYLA